MPTEAPAVTTSMTERDLLQMSCWWGAKTLIWLQRECSGVLAEDDERRLCEAEPAIPRYLQK